MNRVEAGVALNDNNDQLVSEYKKLTMLVNDEAQRRADSLAAHFATENITTAKALTDVQTVGLSKLVTECRNRIAALETDRDHMRFMVKHGMEAQL